MKTLMPGLLAFLFAAASESRAQDCGLYEYRTTIIRVYDGDTVWADFDLGFNMTLRNEPLRLHRVDTPEVKGAQKAQGVLVRDLLAERILEKQVTICTVKRKDGAEKKGTFHRYLAEVWVDGLNINDWLLAAGHAEFDDGK